MLNQPWLGSGLALADVRAVAATRHADLDATYLLAQQIGPILAEGTKGNPRQIKRFLNALLVTRAIAKARGFGDTINQPALAKLMLAERFQPDFYEQIATAAMVAKDGKVAEVNGLETAFREAGSAERPEGKRKKVADATEPRGRPFLGHVAQDPADARSRLFDLWARAIRSPARKTRREVTSARSQG